MIKGETVLTGGEHPGTELEIIKTHAGHYLGFRDKYGMPYSRETYYMPKSTAETVLALIRGK